MVGQPIPVHYTHRVSVSRFDVQCVSCGLSMRWERGLSVMHILEGPCVALPAAALSDGHSLATILFPDPDLFV